jgi:hypothetical protein
VSWITGEVAPAELAEVGVPVILDGAQGAGAVETDVQALGCVAYAALTGESPLIHGRGTTAPQAGAPTNTAPGSRPAATGGPSVIALTPTVSAIIDKALARDPAARYASARELVAALDTAARLASEGQTRPVAIEAAASPVGRVGTWAQRNMALAAVGAGIAVLVLVTLAAGVIGFGPKASPTAAALATDAPSNAATELPTEAATDGATTGPIFSAGPLSAEEATLVQSLPIVFTASQDCAHWGRDDGDVLSPDEYDTSTAQVVCPPPAGGSHPIEYLGYATKQELDDEFNALMEDQGVVAGGDCPKGTPADTPWAFPGRPTSGHYACFERGDGVEYVWTQYQLGVLGQWLAPDNLTGLEFWRSWTKTPNAEESALIARLPKSATQAGACMRAAEKYYESALAILQCPKANQSDVYYVLFPEPSDFPNDPMTTTFFSVMANGKVPADTTEGCYENKPGRYTWGYRTNGVVGDTQGYVGCYLATEGKADTEIVWTFNRSAVMAAWLAPDITTAWKYFDTWIGEVR